MKECCEGRAKNRVWEEERCVNKEGSSWGYKSSVMFNKRTIKETFRAALAALVLGVYFVWLVMA